jgi:hypothetical protein
LIETRAKSRRFPSAKGGAVAIELDVQEWAEQQFEACEFGNKRRVERMVKLAAEVAAKPDASTPKQTEDWADCKAAYRLFARKEVTFDAVVAPHCAQTRAAARGVCLILNDTTEINYGPDRQIKKIGRVGSINSQGFYLHSALMLDENGEITGMAAQDLYKRPLKKVTRVSSAQRKLLPRETDVWGRVIDRAGEPPTGSRFIHVCDRGADNFEIYCHLLEQRADWVIRAAQLRRRTHDAHGQQLTLDEAVSAEPCLGTYELQVAANKRQPARLAKIEVRCARVIVPRPTTGASKYVRARGVEQIEMWAVEAREASPPRGATALRWVLLTSEVVQTFDDAWRVIEWYERRPLIEEYHKCLKTGCGVEQREYQHADRLAGVIGLLSVVSVRLLHLKTIARVDPDRPAKGLAPSEWLATLPLVLKRPRPLITIRDFMRALASLGGFLCRKGDGEPGWQTIWRGLEKLLLIVRGATAHHQRYG